MNLSSFWTSTVLRGLEMGLEWQSAYGKHIYNPALNYTWPWRMDCTAQSPQSKHPRAKAIPPSQSPLEKSTSQSNLFPICCDTHR